MDRKGWPSSSACRWPTTASSCSASRAATTASSPTHLGCAFYGAFAAKVLVVRLHRFPGSTAGGLLFAVLIAVWYTSAVWFLRLAGVGL